MKAGRRRADRSLAFFEAIYARDGGACTYCGVPTRRRRPGLHRATDLATLDHVVPKSKGGPLTAANVVLACQACNNARGMEDAETFRARRSGAPLTASPTGANPRDRSRAGLGTCAAKEKGSREGAFEGDRPVGADMAGDTQTTRGT